LPLFKWVYNKNTPLLREEVKGYEKTKSFKAVPSNAQESAARSSSCRRHLRRNGNKVG
jgi:hypothetical protein